MFRRGWAPQTINRRMGHRSLPIQFGSGSQSADRSHCGRQLDRPIIHSNPLNIEAVRQNEQNTIGNFITWAARFTAARLPLNP